MIIRGYGDYYGPYGFDRGMQTTIYCGNAPESWIRGSVELDTDAGSMTMYVQLETNSASAGPKGKLRVTVNDADNIALAVVETSEIGIGGKTPGPAKIEGFQLSTALSPDIAHNARSLYIEALHTGSVNQLFGNDLGRLFGAFKAGISISAACVSES